MRIIYDDGETYLPAWVAAARSGQSLRISVGGRDFVASSEERAVRFIRARASDRGTDWDWLPCLISPRTDGAILLVGGWPLDDGSSTFIRVHSPDLPSYLQILLDDTNS
jgi:hypothetical protein